MSKKKEKEELRKRLEEFFKKYGIKDYMEVVSFLFKSKDYVSLGEVKDVHRRGD